MRRTRDVPQLKEGRLLLVGFHEVDQDRVNGRVTLLFEIRICGGEEDDGAEL